MKKDGYNHHSLIRVRNFEVDWQGIVHNAIYLQYFEVGRIEYLRTLGLQIDLTTITNDSRVVLARNEVDYHDSAKFDDELRIWTRVSYIRNTSFAFQGIMETAGSNRLIAENVAVHVWLNARTGRPTPVPEHFRSMVKKFEGAGFADLQPPLIT